MKNFCKQSICVLLAVILCTSMILPVAYATGDPVLSNDAGEMNDNNETVNNEDTDQEVADDATEQPTVTSSSDDTADESPASDETLTVEADDEESATTPQIDPEASSKDLSDEISDDTSDPEGVSSDEASEDATNAPEAEADTLSAPERHENELVSTADSKTYEFKVGETHRLYRSDIQSLFGDSSASGKYYGIGAVGSTDIHYFSTLNLLLGKEVDAGNYIAYRTTVNGGNALNVKPNWSAGITADVTVKMYYEATLTVEGNEDGAVVLNGSEESGVVKLYTDTEYTVTAKQIDNYVYSISGAEDGVAFTPSGDSGNMTITITYMKNEYATVTLNANEGGSVAVKSGDKTVTDKVQAGESFTVEATPDTSNHYYVESVKVMKGSDEITGPTYGPVADGESYTITVTFAQAVLTLADGEVNLFDIQNGNYDALESQILAGASFVPEELAASATVTVKYNAGSLITNWQSLDYSSIISHKFGEQSLGGSVKVGNTEKVQVTYSIPSLGLELKAEATVTVADLRIPTTISGRAVSVTYGDDLKATILPRITIIGEDGKNVSFTEDDITIEPQTLNVKLLQSQDVTVKFAGNDEYAASEGTISVYVRQATSSLDVKSETINYGETPALQIDTDPDDLDFIRVIAGVDGDATGYISIDIPQSTKEMMKIEVAGITVIDFYEVLSSMMGDGVNLNGLQNIISTINDLAQSSLIAGALEAAGFNVEALQTVLGLISGLPTIDANVMITLGNAPKNAGIYLVTAVSADLNHRLAADVGYLTILPKTTNNEDTVELHFTEDIPGTLNVLSYEAAQTFSFGGGLYVNGEKIDSTHVRALYVGNSNDNGISAQSNEPIREPGIYTETIYVLGGNYLATPIVRVYTVQRIATQLKMDDDTVTYDGNGHTLTAYEDTGYDLKNNVSYVYAGNGYLGNIPPVSAGTYTVTATYPGDSTHLPAVVTATLTIKKAEATITATCKDEVVYGTLTDEDVSALDLGYNVSGVIGNDYLGGIQPIINKTDNYPHVGTYEATVSFRQLNNNYNVTIKNATFKITPRPVTLTIDTVTKTYGDEDPELTYSIDNLVQCETLDVTLSRAEGADVGDYPITATVAENPDYIVTTKGEYVPPVIPEDNGTGNGGLAATGVDGDPAPTGSESGLFRIIPRRIYVVVNNASKKCGEKDPGFTCTVSDGTNDYDPKDIGLTLKRTEGEDPGDYLITYELDNKNYVIVESKSSDGIFTIKENPPQPEPETDNTEATVAPTEAEESPSDSHSDGNKANTPKEPVDPTDPAPNLGKKSTDDNCSTTVDTNPAAPKTGNTWFAAAMLVIVILGLAALLIVRSRQKARVRNRRFL